ncbi:unnamed protein product, partial [Polarella glacialis]
VPRTLFRALYEDLLKAPKKLSAPSLAAALLNSARGATGQLRSWDDEVRDSPEASPFSSNPSSMVPLCDTRLLDMSEARIQKDLEDLAVRDLTSVVLAYTMAHAGSA